MNQVIESCTAQNAERLERMQQYERESNRKLVGFLCSQTPEELIYASGMLPVRILGSQAPLQEVDNILQTYICSFARSCLDLMLVGKYRFLEGAVVPHSCDTIRGLFGIIDRNVPFGFTHYIKYPSSLEKPEAGVLIWEEFRELKDKLEKFTGKIITNDALKEAIAVYNKNRQLLKELAAYRLQNNLRISGKDFMEVVLAGFTMDKKDHNVLLEKLLADLAEQQPTVSNKPRILVIGNVLDNAGLFGMIEDCGADVVGDDLCSGTRYFGGMVDETNDPMEALVQHYVTRTYCPSKGRVVRRISYLLDMAEKCDAQGIIMLHQTFCDTHQWDVKNVRDAFEAKNIPVLELEYEQFAVDEHTSGGIKTRFQSLIEMIGGK